MEELRRFLSRIEEVTDYVLIYGSLTITSLDFLKSLKKIGGKQLRGNRYSLLVYDMVNLQSLFTNNVTSNLRIDNGTMRFYRNPVLCVSEINKIKQLFPVQPNEIDVPQGMNGYSGSCKEVALGLQVRVTNEKTALVMFSPIENPDFHYSVLYVKVPPTVESTIVPESCSESEWFAITVTTMHGNIGYVELNSLRPASTYAVCVESYDPVRKLLTRSPVSKFNTPVGKPAPPFITELFAYSANSVTLHWVDHRDYHKYITSYQLDVTVLDLDPNDAIAQDHCKDDNRQYTDDGHDFSRHAVVKKLPPDYGKYCKSICGVLSTVTDGTIIEDDFDICTSLDRDRGCDIEEPQVDENTTVNGFVTTLILNIPALISDFKVEGLAPFRDYRFRLRACTDTKCSPSARGVIQTFPSKDADRVKITQIVVNKEGALSIAWKAPEVYNGLILAYYVQVFPQRKSSKMGYAMPQSWCVLSNQSKLDIITEKTSKYIVRICTKSMADTTCGDWETVLLKEERTEWWWSGIVAGVTLYLVSAVIATYWRPRRESGDTTLLMEDMDTGETSRIFDIPLRDTLFDQ